MTAKQKKLFSKFLLATPFLVVGSLVVIYLSAAGLTTSKSQGPVACEAQDFTGSIDPSEKLAIYEGQDIKVPQEALAQNDKPSAVLGLAVPDERWIEVDLSEQKLRAWDGNSLYLETLVSSGLPYYPTPKGEFRIWIKLRATKMEGGEGRYYYYLPNVPYVMFLENNEVPAWKGYGLHGTYWHNDFGTVHSHGCVNLPTNIAEQLYYWTGPAMPEGKRVVYASPENPGTRVIIHE